MVDPAKAGAAVEQEIWRAVHREGAAAALCSQGLAQLRFWAGERMRNHRYAAIETGKPTVMRATFIDAIAHAARDLSEGRVPE